MEGPLFSTKAESHIYRSWSMDLIGMTAAVYAEAIMHVPIDTIAKARETAQLHQADGIIAFGGGSALDTSKAVALELEVPIIAVPTTYGGSEVTPFYGYTEGGIKKGKRDRKMLPKTVIYDPALTVSLPASVSGPSGMNAIAHCVEAAYASIYTRPKQDRTYGA